MKCGLLYIIKNISLKTLKHLIVIEGPTASGKTALGVELAKQFNTVVISADSRQLYKELSIGTAKPTLEEQANIFHYMVDSHSLTDEITSAVYAREVNEILAAEFKTHDKIILVGGSGMFIDAVCIGLDEIPKSDQIKRELTIQWEKEGLQNLLEELKSKDLVFYDEVDKGNPMRIIRALEAIRITGQPFSTLRTKQEKKHSFEITRFVINHEREVLYDRINRRVDIMMGNGLLEEVKSVEHLKHISTLRTVGYSELFDFLDGNTTIENAVNLIKQNTRRYAKRQLTWFRRHPEAIWLMNTTTKEMVIEISNKFLE